MTDLDAHYSAMIRSGDWLDAQDFPPLRWAVPGIVPEGFGLLVGPPKAGKSWAALSIILAVASGGKVFGTVDVGTARPVLYLALEDGDRRLQDRARLLLEREAIPKLMEFATRTTPADAVGLMAWWLERNHDGLIVLDTLGRVSPPSVPGESAYARDYRIGSTLKRLVDDHPGSTLIAVHHDRKAGAEDFVDSVSGTHGLAGASDFLIVLDRHRQEQDGVLKVTGRDVREAEYAVTMNGRGQWTLRGNSLHEAAQAASAVKSKAGLGDRSAEIIEFVTSQPTAVSAGEVQEALDVPDARRYLARLVDAGRLHRPARGLYAGVPNVPLSQEGNVIYPSGWDNGTDGTPTDTGDAS
ncbi:MULTISPECIES: AAA family ATPase [unclassified Aeromicrobium]|uniref:AAA family ATPase n=1 Tax=unclassified Aeromicrobium TaxID=2633570 RepID=UPI00396B0CB2